MNQVETAAVQPARPQRFFEDIDVGSDLPRQAKGPIATRHIVRWSAAMENWHRIVPPKRGEAAPDRSARAKPHHLAPTQIKPPRNTP